MKFIWLFLSTIIWKQCCCESEFQNFIFPDLKFESHSDMHNINDNPVLYNANKAQINQWLIDEGLYTQTQIDEHRLAMITYVNDTYGFLLEVEPTTSFFDAKFEAPGLSIVAVRFNETAHRIVRQLRINNFQFPKILLDKTRQHAFGWIIQFNNTYESVEKNLVVPAGQTIVWGHNEFIINWFGIEKRTTIAMQSRLDYIVGEQLERSTANGVVMLQGQLIFTEHAGLDLVPLCDYYGTVEQDFVYRVGNATHPTLFIHRTSQNMRCPGNGKPVL